MESKPVTAADSDDDSDIEEVDSATAALQAKIRARMASAKEEQPGHIVQLFIDTQIPGTNALLIKYRSNNTLEKIRKSWCAKQNYTPAQTEEVFLTWKMNRLFDSTKVERCGIRIDAQGCVTVDGSTDIYTEDDPPKVHLQAWTDKTFREFKNAKIVEKEAQKKIDEDKASDNEGPVPGSEPAEQKKVRLILKAKGKDDFKIAVKPVSSYMCTWRRIY